MVSSEYSDNKYTASCRRRNFCGSAQTVLLVELIDLTLGSCCLLCAGIERMALGTYFDVDLFLGGSGHESVAAVAGNCCLVVSRMNSFSHRNFLLMQCARE